MKMFRKKILRKKKILINPKISQIISKRSLTIELTIKIKIRWTSLGKKSFVGIKKVLHKNLYIICGDRSLKTTVKPLPMLIALFSYQNN